MDVLRNKKVEMYDYVCRYTGVPYYYNSEDDREIYGLGSNLKKETSWVAHKIRPEDTLDSLSLKYYANPSFWWVIAYFNNIQDSFIKLSDYYDIIKIPSISGIVFGDER